MSESSPLKLTNETESSPGLISLDRIIAHQKAQLADADRKYLAAVTHGNWAVANEQARRYNRIWNALVLHGAMDSAVDADREAEQAERERNSVHAPLPVYSNGE